MFSGVTLSYKFNVDDMGRCCNLCGLEASGRKACSCLEVDSDIGQEFVREGKFSETLWTWSNCQYCQWAA